LLVLRKHKVETLEQRMACGMGGKLGDVPVFSFLGQWIPPDKVSRDWARNAKVKATFHSLRHTHASVLLNNGVDILTVSKRLGHSKPSITPRRAGSSRDSRGPEMTAPVASGLQFLYVFLREKPATL
jgi:integrase